MLALPYVPSSDCIETLAVLGYRPGKRAATLAWLHRGSSVVVVPEGATLSPALLGAILRAAEIEVVDFLEALGARRAASAARVANVPSRLACGGDARAPGSARCVLATH